MTSYQSFPSLPHSPITSRGTSSDDSLLSTTMTSFSSSRMQWHQKLAFSFGHIFNDLCGAMWFSLLLVFLQYVVHFPANLAGYLMMWGQVVHAVSTPLAGYESDRIDGLCCFGKRKSWHFIGTVAVGLSFPFVFMRCIACDAQTAWAAQLAYYVPFIAIFQFGWASAQVAHMTLMSQLARCSADKMELSGLRNAGTLLSSIIVFSLGWGFFGPSKAKEWDAADESKFTLLMIIVTAVGLTCSLIFHLGLHEEPFGVHKELHQQNDSVSSVDPVSDPSSILWSDWLKEPQFYIVSLLYMFSRLIVNVAGAYFPFYVFETLHMDKKFMSIIPLVMNLTGFFLSLLMRCVTSRTGQKFSLLVGILLTVAGCAWLWAIDVFKMKRLQVIGPSAFIGASGSILTVTSLVMTSDVIGSHTGSGAFVFGAMSPMDKLASGTAILLIQQFSPCSWAANSPISAAYFNIVMVYVVGSFAIALLVLLVFIWPQKLGMLRKTSGKSTDSQRQDVSILVVSESTDNKYKSNCGADGDETKYLLSGSFRRYELPTLASRLDKNLNKTLRHSSESGARGRRQHTGTVLEQSV